MCEFRVVSKTDKGEQDVGEDIVHVRVSDGAVELKDILGVTSTVNEAMIEEVDVKSEVLKLVASPLLPKLHRFLEAYRKCEAEKAYSEDVENLWNEVKAFGDETIRNLWKKYGMSDS